MYVNSPMMRNLGFENGVHWPTPRPSFKIGTFRSDYDNDYEFFNVYPVSMRVYVRLSRQLVLSLKSRRRLDASYEIFNKSRPPTASSLQVQRRVKRLVFKVLINCEMFCATCLAMFWRRCGILCCLSTKHSTRTTILGTFRSDYDYEYEYDF